MAPDNTKNNTKDNADKDQSAIPYDQNEANKEAANNTEIRILNPLEWLIMYPVTIS